MQKLRKRSIYHTFDIIPFKMSYILKDILSYQDVFDVCF